MMIIAIKRRGKNSGDVSAGTALSDIPQPSNDKNDNSASGKANLFSEIFRARSARSNVTIGFGHELLLSC